MHRALLCSALAKDPLDRKDTEPLTRVVPGQEERIVLPRPIGARKEPGLLDQRVYEALHCPVCPGIWPVEELACPTCGGRVMTEWSPLRRANMVHIDEGDGRTYVVRIPKDVYDTLRVLMLHRGYRNRHEVLRALIADSPMAQQALSAVREEGERMRRGRKGRKDG